ncbi:chromosome segregation ATPase [Stutzerimonas stutzeri]|uniref:chromosome partitioning protein ParA n=1 Tax=Stutzerimonas stutzeri subgroup TaxID=578833 RepID=UPI000C6CC39A|nr:MULTISPECIES: chromosome partitioning protein ParA [Stutzerimonas stutzeri subgroup]MCQ2048953.1 chromosome partitioning protein ParA [Stutzerimonas kunmingensis]PKR26631.1 chromosome partitioning protein ParA [Stutzerimonas stutzeri]QQC09435.1 chromosome partitioning protein ParA [Stutzerimonas stutzeri]VEI35177.1 chromosome segregation ATPase [Stutzerimonas stutzeri]
MQNKPQMVEAVLFFNEGSICKEMLYPEFEAVLDGVVALPEFADRQMHAVYVMINPRLQVRAAVFFCLDFNDDGSADAGWNIPLRQLAERTGRGPDMGAGPIRLACRSQCPVSWHQMHMWDPKVGPERNDLVVLRETIKRNQLGLLVEEETPQAVPAERLQMVAEDTWYAAEAGKDAAAKRSESHEREQRQKAALLIKQQRQRITNLERLREEDALKLTAAAEKEREALQEEIRALQQKLQQQAELNASLHAQMTAQGESFQKAREEMSKQLRTLEVSGRVEIGAAREQFEHEAQARIAAAIAEYKEQVAIRDVELAYRNELDAQLEEEIQRLKAECETLRHSGDRVLEELSRQGVVFMAYHPGAGHLTIALQDLARYRANPLAYAAAKCFVSEEQYRQWLEHYQKPACVAALSSGERCAMPLDKIDAPSRFVIGESNCCARHRKEDRQRTGS